MKPHIIRRVLFLTLVVLAFDSHALTPSQVFDTVKDSVVVVKTFGAKGAIIGQGSGVLLPSGKIGTNCHVLENGARFQVGGGKQFAPATFWGGDKDKDICLLEARGLTAKPAQLGQATRLRVGEPVYAVGAPQGLELSLSDGIVSQLRGGPPPIIQTTAAISPGSSGGGLFDSDGRLVGFTTLYINGGQSLNFAMPVEWLAGIKPGARNTDSGRSQVDWLKRAYVLEERKDWQELLEWCREWTMAVPKDVLAWYALGLAYDNLNRHTDAIEAYRQALRIDPKNRGAWVNLGHAYYPLNRHIEAIEAYRQALRIDPKDADAWYDLGLAYYLLGRYTEAIEAYRQALRINPKYAMAWNNLGSTYRDLNRDTDAINAYRQAVRIDPEHAMAWNNLGLAYFRSGNRSAAIEAVRQLRRLDPAKADALSDLIGPR